MKRFLLMATFSCSFLAFASQPASHFKNNWSRTQSVYLGLSKFLIEYWEGDYTRDEYPIQMWLAAVEGDFESKDRVKVYECQRSCAFVSVSPDGEVLAFAGAPATKTSDLVLVRNKPVVGWSEIKTRQGLSSLESITTKYLRERGKAPHVYNYVFSVRWLDEQRILIHHKNWDLEVTALDYFLVYTLPKNAGLLEDGTLEFFAE